MHQIDAKSFRNDAKRFTNWNRMSGRENVYGQTKKKKTILKTKMYILECLIGFVVAMAEAA